MAKIKLSSNDHGSARDGSPVPEGNLPALVASVDDAAVNDPKMPVLKLQFAITADHFKTKTLYRTFRLRSKQDLETLKTLCDVVGLVMDANEGFNSDDLIGRELIVVVRVVSRSWKDKNGEVVIQKFPDVVSFKRVDDSDAGEVEGGRDGARDDRPPKRAKAGARRRPASVGGTNEND